MVVIGAGVAGLSVALDLAPRPVIVLSAAPLGSGVAKVLTAAKALGSDVHVLVAGRVVATGGPELADKLEAIGYEGLVAELGIEGPLSATVPTEADPFADPLGF